MSSYASSIVRPPKTFTDHERHGLLRATGERVGGFRDHVLYSMAENTALRQMELLALNVGDLLDPGGRVRRRIVLRVFKRSNKNVDDQTVFLSDTVRAKVARLIELRRRGGEVLGPDSPLFVSSRGTRLSARRVRSAFASWQRRAGFERQVNFHTIRHDAINSFHRRERDIRLAQRFARHASIASTQIYTHPSDEDLYRAVQNQTA